VTWFDGDEMNLHMPQSVEAATELREIAAVGKQLISPKLSKPLVSVVQDTLVGVNRLTRPTEFFTRRETMNMLVHSKRWDGNLPPPARTDPIPMWSGQQIVSCLLPAVYLSMGNKAWDKKKGKADPNYVVIQNGQIQQGILDGDVFDKALIHILYNDFSPEMTVDFLDSLQAVVATYLQNSGFSVGMSDIIADADTLAKISIESEELKKKLESLQLQVHMGLFDNSTGRTNQEEFEGRVFQTLNAAIEAAGKTGLSSLATTNRMVNMVKCGSKGSNLNIAQMIALLGQQSIEGKRIAYGFQDRTLPHFKRFDDGAAARGFIESSFVKGLQPHEFFFHAMTGREGLIDTAVKTADSGYMQRQLVKTMEDLLTWHDGSIRDAGNIVVQFSYGDDGTSATKIENQTINLAELTDTEIRNRFAVEDVAADRSQAFIAAVMADRDLLVQNVFSGRVARTVQSSVHLPRLIADTIEQLHLDPNAAGYTPATGTHILDTIERIIKSTRSDNLLWAALVRHNLNPRDLKTLGFTRNAVDWLAEQIIIKHMRSWVVPGEMSGIIAAQSLGETTTQLTLNTFHLSGYSGKSAMTRGVPRLKELFKVTQNPKATSLTIFLRSDLRGSKEEARRLAQELEFTMLKDLVTTSRIYYDPPTTPGQTLIEADQEWLAFFTEFEATNGPASAAEAETQRNPWIIRMELNREKMFNKNFPREDINFVLKTAHPTVNLAYTDHNSTQMILRFSFAPDSAAKKNSINDLEMVKNMQNKILMQTLVRGLPGLKAVSFRKLTGDDELYERNPNADGKYEPVNQFVLDTFGSNFLDVMIHPDVDGTRLLSNHVHEIYDNLGIEAARAVLFREIYGLFEAQAPVNYRHINILVDAMTNRGRLMSADRIGVNKKTRIGPLAKASFEQTEHIMRRAAMFGEMDPVTSVAANIMTGQPIRGGTSFTQILLDEQAFIKLMKTAPLARRNVERAPKLVQAEIEALLESRETPGCRQVDLRIPAALPAVQHETPPEELPELEITLVDE